MFDPFGFAWLGLLEGALLRIKQSSGSHTRVVGFPHVIAGKNFFFWKLREEGGPGFAARRSLPIWINRGVGEKFSEILEDSEFVWHGCGHGAVGGVFCDATNQELSKSSCAKPRYRPGTSMDCK